MKKTFVFLLLLGGVSIAKAQSVNLGLKGGLNLASTDNSDRDDIRTRIGYHGGLFANIPVSSQIRVQPEVLYSSQGSRYDVLGQEVDLALNYINIPLMVQAMVGRGFYAQAGPQLGILTSVSDKVNGTQLGAVTKEQFKSTDIGLGIGLGVKGRNGLGLDARYNFGLTDINNSGRSNTIRNNVFQLGLQVQLGGNR